MCPHVIANWNKCTLFQYPSWENYNFSPHTFRGEYLLFTHWCLWNKHSAQAKATKFNIWITHWNMQYILNFNGFWNIFYTSVVHFFIAKVMDSNMINAWKIFWLDSINIPFFESSPLISVCIETDHKISDANMHLLVNFTGLWVKHSNREKYLTKYLKSYKLHLGSHWVISSVLPQIYYKRNGCVCIL